MIILVVGIPDSGKSRLAEELAIQYAGNLPKYYIATMVPYGEAGLKRVEKHRAMRAGKGFETIEQTVHVEQLSDRLSAKEPCVGLLECMSNLVGNEMYAAENEGASTDALAEKILCEVRALGKCFETLVVVTNVFLLEEEGYDDETRQYVQLVALVNEKLMKLADAVYQKKEGEWVRNENL